MKRFSKMLSVLLILSVIPVSAATYQLVTANYSINVNGQKIAVQPLNLNGTTYLPLRSISEAVGVPIEWDGVKKSVEITTLDVDKLKESCVMIYASDGETYQQGSGVYVDYNQVLTAYHIVDENRTQARTMVDTEDVNKMNVSSFDSKIDIATLTPAVEKKPVKIGDSDEVKAGDKVIFIGSPDGKNTVIQTTVKYVSETIAINAEVKSGASGGALFSINGELIGILVSGNDGLKESYIVPINVIREAL